MVHLYLNQGGMETDVTAQSEIVCSADATFRLGSDPVDGVIRVTVRTSNFRINKSFSGEQVFSGVDLGPALDYAAGLRIVAMYEGKPNSNLSFTIREGAGSTPVDPGLLKPEPVIKPLVVTPATPVDPAADPAELALLKAQNADLKSQLSTVAGEVSSLQAKNAELQEEIAGLRAAAGSAEDALSRIAELEKQLDDAARAYGLKTDAEGLAREIERLTRELETKKNQRFELEMDELPAAEDALKQAQASLAQAQQKLADTNAELTAAQAAVTQAEADLADLQSRHTDAQRALTELKELRDQLGMHDGERILLEQQLADVQATLTQLEADLAAAQASHEERQARLAELSAQEEADAQKLTDLTAHQEELNASLRQLEKEIADLDYLQKNKAHEWEEKVRKLSAILADVLQTELDLRVTYSILTTARQDDYFKRLGEEAQTQWAVLEECSARMTQVRDWVRNIKNMQAQSQEGN